MLRLMRFFFVMVVSAFLACSFAIAQTPTISSITPNPGGIGQSVTITGTNYGTSGSVTFNGVTASTTSWTSTAIIATVPVGATTGNVVVTANGAPSKGFAFTVNNGPVNYVYDDLGRLLAVIDVNGNAAEYSYDPVGNILAISRFTSTQVSIINFAPESGPTGTAVTINGTGFSTTPAQNTVKFNGIVAVVSSATNDQLQATVPAGASTGPISVTCPNGSATSTGNFTVTASSGVPTIAAFNPASGLAGATLSLSGTNFNSIPANDKLRLNASQAAVSAATSTTLTSGVPPSTASGRFTLITPAGNAVSSQDFYVPFLTHVPGDIGFTARISPSASVPVSLGTSKIAMVLFDAIEGQHADVAWTGSTFSACNLYLIAPDNSTTASTTCTSTAGDLGSTYLPKSGTYTIGIDPGTSSGGLTLSLNVDIVGTITVGGPPVIVTTTNPGQDVRLDFTQTASQHVVIYATNVSNPGATVTLVTLSGLTVASMPISNSPSGQAFYVGASLSPGQVYQLWVQHSGANVGSETLQIIPDFAATIGMPAAGTTSSTVQVPTTGNLVLGQNASLTFSATAGQMVSFNLSNSTFSGCDLYLFDPNGNQLLWASPGGYGCGYVNTTTLDLNGTYTFYLVPTGQTMGSISFSMNNDQNVTTPAISIGGSAVTTGTTVPGQDVVLSFAATAGERVVVYGTNVTNPGAYLNLVTSGSIIASQYISPSPNMFYIDTQTLTATGNELWVEHAGAAFGGETLQIGKVPPDVSHTITIGGAGYQFSTVAGQNANISFKNPTSQSVTVHWVNGTYPNSLGCNVIVTGPSPSTSQVGPTGGCWQTSGTVSLGTIPSGTYNILIDPQFWSAGGLTISVTTP